MPQFKNYVTFYQPEQVEIDNIVTSMRLIEREVNYLNKSRGSDFELSINEAITAIKNIFRHRENLNQLIEKLQPMQDELQKQKMRLEVKVSVVKD